VAGQFIVLISRAREGTWKRRLASWTFDVENHIRSAFADELGLTVWWKSRRVIGHN
jgi:hypothetical protein